VVAAALVLCIPTLTHIGASVNNDDLLILLGAALTVLVARIARGDTSWGTSLGSGELLGLALLTKGFALVLIPCLTLAYAVALVPARRWGELVRRGGAALAVAFVIGGWWWARNLLVHGVLLPGVGLRDRVPVEPDVSEFATHYAERLLTSTWGSFGWNEAALPMPLVAVASALLVAAVAVVLCVRRRGDLAVMVVPAALLTVLITANAWRAYLKTGVPYASQGRYLFAGLVGVLVVAAAALGLLPERARRFGPAAVLAGAAVLHLLSIGAIVERYWSGRWLAALLAFSPWPPLAVGAVVLALLAVASSAAASVRPAREEPGLAWDDRTVAGTGSVIVAPHGK
jgi:4-amino-4-deoxy-L-arabinose transferase-like glycosyltransferase